MPRHLMSFIALLSGCAGGVAPDLEPPPLPVKVVELAAAPMPRSFEASGVAEARHQVTVLSEGAGRVVELSAMVGQQVREGDALLRLESGRQRTGVKAAEASLAKAQAVLEDAQAKAARARRLTDALSPADLESIELAEKVAAADLAAAEANLAAQRRALADTTARAPFDGVVSRSLVDVGQVIGVGTPLMGVVDAAELRVRLGLPWADAAALKLGDPVLIEGPGGQLSGAVVEQSLELDRATGSVPVEVRAPNPEGLILPNSPVTVTLHEAEGRSLLAVPRDAVMERYGEPVAFVVEGDRASLRRVELGVSAGGRVEVASGLEPGELLVVVGAGALIDGARVDAQR